MRFCVCSNELIEMEGIWLNCELEESEQTRVAITTRETMYEVLSSTLPEIDPDTAYVVCISVSLGFRQKPSDTALLSVIALTTFNCIVSASVTKGALVCFVVTVHWWLHRTHYDVTVACRALHNIPTVHLNNGAPRADLRGIPKHCEVTAKAGRQSTIYGWFWCDFLYH